MGALRRSCESGGLHSLDQDRLFEFAARAFVLDESINVEELRADLAARGFSEQAQRSVITTLEDATGLFRAYEAARHPSS
jgi:hypothetical protein